MQDCTRFSLSMVAGEALPDLEISFPAHSKEEAVANRSWSWALAASAMSDGPCLCAEH